MKRRFYDDRRQQFRANQKPIGSKNIENRSIRNRGNKIKKVLAEFKF